MKMKTFAIIDMNNGEIITEIQAAQQKSALKKFAKELISTGFSEIHKISDSEYELGTTYGRYYRAVERR